MTETVFFNGAIIMFKYNAQMCKVCWIYSSYSPSSSEENNQFPFSQSISITMFSSTLESRLNQTCTYRSCCNGLLTCISHSHFPSIHPSFFCLPTLICFYLNMSDLIFSCPPLVLQWEGGRTGIVIVTLWRNQIERQQQLRFESQICWWIGLDSCFSSSNT